MNEVLIGSILSALLIVFSFVALLAQKVYVQNDDTTKTTIVELPLLGKMKTNYPALVLAFLGVGLALYSLNLGTERKTPWEIEVRPTTATANIDWQETQLAIFPCCFDIFPDPATGKQTIHLQIDVNKSFEDVVERIQFSHKFGGSATIYTKKALDARNHNEESQLKNYSSRTRSYEITLEPYPPQVGGIHEERACRFSSSGRSCRSLRGLLSSF